MGSGFLASRHGCHDLWGIFPVHLVVGAGIGDTTISFGIESVPDHRPVI